MKNFITSMLGTLAALVIFAAVGTLLMFGLLGALVAASHPKKAPEVVTNSYLVLDLSTNITDAPPVFDFDGLSGGRSDTLQLRQVARALRMAAFDSHIKGVLLLGNLEPSGYGSGFAALKEIRGAIGDFRDSGKPVIAFLTYASNRDYYLASAAGEVDLDPYGVIMMPGLASQPMFYAGAFEKYGIGVQVTRVGKYKSYVEPFTRTDMSPENREQLQKLLDDLWGTMVSDISKARKIDAASIQGVVDSEGMIKPAVALKSHLIDRVAYRDEIIARLKKDTGVTSPTESFRQIQIGAYIKTLHSNQSGSGKVAIVYAEGDIVDGEGDATEVGGARFAREIRALREDSSVKAIVLRVNSPGGSASAAETIQRELRLAKQVKPVIVSMGSVAASGGYWISAYGDKIFAEPNTITGSIGVFGIQFDVQKLANDHGITFDSVKTGKFADALTIARPKTPEELAVTQRMVDWIYGQFVAKVAEGRKLKPAFVEDIAQGRVWSGVEAKKLGLVDEIGGLHDAVLFAGSKAGLGTNFRLEEYPRSKNFQEALAEMFGKLQPISLHVKDTSVVGILSAKIEAELGKLKAFNDPRGVYARMPEDLQIQ